MQWLEPQPPWAYQEQRVEVGLALTQPPMQTRRRHAPGVSWLKQAERIAGDNRLPNPDQRRDRLVRRTQAAAVGDADHPAPSQTASELHHSRTSRPHCCPDPRG
jgi:hypothetical protein